MTKPNRTGSRNGPGSRPTAPFDAELITRRIEELAALTDEPGRLTRLYLGPAHSKAADLVASWMRDAGMAPRLDATGSVVGRYDGADSTRGTLLLGSHIDTVRNAGRFDGTLGVLASIAVIERLAATGRRLPFAVEVLAFGDEEGVRFPSTLTGSRALAGRFDPKVLYETDRDGITRRTALTNFGCNPARIASEARDPQSLIGYIELHIEQGPVLEAAGLPVGVVTAINGATRGRVDVTGVAGHAGTVPMSMRNDALAAAAQMLLALERRVAGEQHLVGTVGVIDAPNGAVNVIPGAVSFTFDVRSPSDASRHAAIADLTREFQRIADRRSVQVETKVTYDVPSATCDTRLASALSDAVARAGLPVRHLPSGAGHDGMSFRDVVPFAMLFVRCRGGISHHPAEYASAADIKSGVRVIADCVEQLAGRV